jgi:hypothetical protein
MKYIALDEKRTRTYGIVAIALLFWAAALLLLALFVVNLDSYWFSYYVVDYSFGFVRRGLAGELIDLFPADEYFVGMQLMRWAATAVFLASLAALSWLMLVRGGRSERRIMLALLVPVLPFGLAFAFYSARPDLFGAATLVAFVMAMAFVRAPRYAVLSSGLYGIVIAVLGLMHEAITLEFALGAMLAILVLARNIAPAMQRVCIVVAIAPGLVVALAVSLLGQHGFGASACSKVPHRYIDDLQMKNSVSGFVDFFFLGRKHQTDFHEWICRNITPLYDYDVRHAMNVVASVGAGLLLLSLVFGMALIVLTIYLVSHFSGVPFAEFRSVLRGRMYWPALGLAMVVPVFLTAHDWVRWCVLIAFNIGIVFLLYATDSPQLATPPTPRDVRALVWVVAVLALIPVGIVPGFAPPVPTATSPAWCSATDRVFGGCAGSGVQPRRLSRAEGVIERLPR